MGICGAKANNSATYSPKMKEFVLKVQDLIDAQDKKVFGDLLKEHPIDAHNFPDKAELFEAMKNMGADSDHFRYYGERDHGKCDGFGAIYYLDRTPKLLLVGPFKADKPEGWMQSYSSDGKYQKMKYKQGKEDGPVS